MCIDYSLLHVYIYDWTIFIISVSKDSRLESNSHSFQFTKKKLSNCHSFNPPSEYFLAWENLFSILGRAVSRPLLHNTWMRSSKQSIEVSSRYTMMEKGLTTPSRRPGVFPPRIPSFKPLYFWCSWRSRIHIPWRQLLWLCSRRKRWTWKTK